MQRPTLACTALAIGRQKLPIRHAEFVRLHMGMQIPNSSNIWLTQTSEYKTIYIYRIAETNTVETCRNNIKQYIKYIIEYIYSIYIIVIRTYIDHFVHFGCVGLIRLGLYRELVHLAWWRFGPSCSRKGSVPHSDYAFWIRAFKVIIGGVLF